MLNSEVAFVVEVQSGGMRVSRISERERTRCTVKVHKWFLSVN